MHSMTIIGMRGLGDNLFQRALLQGITACDTPNNDFYLDTPWPELYEDIGVRCVRAVTALRTQAKNVRNSKYSWYQAPKGQRAYKIGYGSQINTGTPIVDILKNQLAAIGIHANPIWRIMDNLPHPVTAPRIAVVRPVTVRREWHNEARNPKAEYVAQASGILQQAGYFVVSVADLLHKEEWAVEPLPPADLMLHQGQLNVLQLLGLIRSAHVVVGGVGWILPAAVTCGIPVCLIAGGQAAHNGPKIVTHRTMDQNKIHFITPDRYCQCAIMKHDCDKVISDFPDQFNHWLRAQHPNARSVAA